VRESPGDELRYLAGPRVTRPFLIGGAKIREVPWHEVPRPLASDHRAGTINYFSRKRTLALAIGSNDFYDAYCLPARNMDVRSERIFARAS